MLDYSKIDTFIRSVLNCRGVRVDEIDDVAQDTWIALLTRGGFECADNMNAYIAKTAKNIWKDEIRKKGPYRSKTPGHAERAKKLKRTRGRARIRKQDTESIDAKDYAYIAIKQPTIETQLIQREQIRVAIANALEHLSERHMEIVRLKIDGHRNTEIVKATNASKTVVEGVIHRFRKGAAIVRSS